MPSRLVAFQLSYSGPAILLFTLDPQILADLGLR